MTLFSPFQLRFLKLLQDNDVRFVVIGGVASVFHGVMRSTGDVDILVQPGLESGARIINAFREFDLDVADVSQEDFVNPLFLSFGFEPDAVDLMNFTPGLEFERVLANSRVISEGNVHIPIASIDDLISNKEKLNRKGSKALIDEFDLIELKRIKASK